MTAFEAAHLPIRQGLEAQPRVAVPAEAPPARGRFTDLRLAIRLFRRHRGGGKAYLVALLFLLFEAATAVIEPFPIAYLIDVLQGAKPDLREGWGLPAFLDSARTETILVLTLGIIVLAAVNKASDSFAEVAMARGGRTLGYNIRVAMYNKLQRLSLAYHDRKRTGDVLTRVTGDVLVVEEFVVASMSNIVASALLLTGSLIVLFFQSWIIALIGLAMIPLLGGISSFYSKRIKKASKEQRSSEGELASTAQEMLTSIRLVQSYGRGHVDVERFSAETDRSMRASLKAANIQAQFSFVIAIFEAFAICGVIWLGVYLVDREQITVGTLVLFILLLQNMFKPARKIVQEWYKVGKLFASVERIDELMRREPVVLDAPDAVAAPPLRGDMAFEGVWFSYPDEHEGVAVPSWRPPVLRAIDFAVAPGEVVALVGHSGAGKSTIAQLVPRLYDPDQGAVRLDGLDIRSFTLESLRGQVSLVLQDTVLLTGSVADNIGYGVEDATREQIEAAARAANAHEFISELPDGYDTVLGERGSTLSGGQRQRIAIARAFIRATPVLVLDEPTTGLDGESTRLVIGALRTLMQGKTTIIISHDLALLRCADRLLVLDGGRVVEEGTHAELLAAGGMFAELYERARHPDEALPEAALPALPEPALSLDKPVTPALPQVVSEPVAPVHLAPVPAGSGGKLAAELAERLPGLRQASDPAFAADAVARLLDMDPARTAVPVRVRSFWYHADGSCALRYAVGTELANRDHIIGGRVHPDHDAAASYVDQVRPLVPDPARAPGLGPWRHWVALEEPAALALHPFPLDPQLPTLADAVDGQAMAAVLKRELAGLDVSSALGRGIAHCTVTIVRHARQGPCVLRYDLWPEHHSDAAPGSESEFGSVYARVYPDGAGEHAAAVHRALHGAVTRADGAQAGRITADGIGLRVPAPLTYIPELHLLVMETLPGSDTLHDLLRASLRSGPAGGRGSGGPPVEKATRAAGRALAALHLTTGLSELPERRLGEDLAALREEQTVIARIWPGVAAEVAQLLTDYAADSSGDLAGVALPSHGDFTPSQLLLNDRAADGHGMSVLDLDTACRADPARDVGRFLAHLHLAGVKAGGDAAWPRLDTLTEAFLSGYEEAAWPWVEVDAPLLDRVAAHRATSLARSALHACRALKDHRLELSLDLLRRGNDWTGRLHP